MKVCVYGASSDAIKKEFLEAGYDLGQALAKRGWSLVFGGGRTGMMGAVSRGVESLSGHTIGVAPHFFKEFDGALSTTTSEFIFTDTMRQRKEKMEKLSDGFIMSAGGIGTFEEFFEILTLKQLGQLHKPICIFNTDGYYDDLHNMLKEIAKENFMADSCLSLFYISSSIEDILNYIEENAEK